MQKFRAYWTKIGWGIALTSLAWLMQPAANAQSDAEILESVRECQEITGMSARLACYDRVLPPDGDSAATGEDSVETGEQRSTTVIRPDPEPAPRRRTPAPRNSEPEPGNTARIVEMERPSFTTFRLIAEDGRVFVQSDARTILPWPDTPFEVEIEIGITGTTFLRVPGVDDRVRVSVEE